MRRPIPTPVMHFTHVDHLPSIIRRGLLADATAHASRVVTVEVGHKEIKQRRSARVVPVAPGGVVADYAPFYFAARSPMLYVIAKGGVPTYSGSCDDLIYLATTVERLLELTLRPVFTDRNAAKGYAAFTSEPAELDDLVDWALMKARMWTDTEDEPDRKERRMAECLVHRRVPWEAFDEIVTRTPACARRVQRALATVGPSVQVVVRRGWYF
ncbi:MAG: type II toxin-antitoxin system toxin DNA ADP-ribosyl transferase DarT [Streptosporangiaceae bacterium]